MRGDMAAEQVAATVVQEVGGHSQGDLGFMCCVCWVGLAARCTLNRLDTSVLPR
jgi:hypothetical protein